MTGLTAETPSEMLHLLMDGELDSTQETTLYNALASSDELKNQMREIIAIRESVRNDIEAFSPTSTATKAVFASVGLTPFETVPVQAPTIVQPVASYFSGLLSKMWAPVVSAIGASLITALLFMNYNKSAVNFNAANYYKDNVPVVSSYGNNTEKNTGNLSKNNIPKITNNVSNTNRKTNNQLSGSNSQPNITEPAIAENVNDANVNDNTNNIAENHNLVGISQIVQSNNKMQGTAFLGTNVQAPSIPNTMNLSDTQSKELGYSFQLRGISGASFPSANLIPESNSMLSNIGIGLYTHLYKNMTIGMEIGQEPFGLWVFENGDINHGWNGKNHQITWFGPSLKGLAYDRLPWLGYGQPFYQFILGGTVIGPISKGIVGLQFNPYSGFGFQLGFESTILFYQYEGTWYTTKKLGITYGMFVNL